MKAMVEMLGFLGGGDLARIIMLVPKLANVHVRIRNRGYI